MMASKNAIVPVGKVMKGRRDLTECLCARRLWLLHRPQWPDAGFPFNSSTTVFHYNKDAFKAARSDTEKPPTTGRKFEAAAAQGLRATNACTTSWVSWTQLESFSAWHNTEFASKGTAACGALMPA